MTIKIKTKQLVIRGVKMFKVLDIEALSDEELPTEYLKHEPNVFFSQYEDDTRKVKELVINCSEYRFRRHYITCTESYHKNDMLEKLGMIKKAGERLSKINKGIKKIKEEWEKEEETVFII